MRADIVTARTAVAHAAWHGRDRRSPARTSAAAARLALPHRRRRNPFDAPGLDEDLLDQILGDDELPTRAARGPGRRRAATDRRRTGRSPRRAAERRPTTPGPARRASERATATTAEAVRHRPAAADDADHGRRRRRRTGPGCSPCAAPGAGEAGRRSRAITETGRRIGAARRHGAARSHLVETLRAAAPHQHGARADRRAGSRCRAEDLRVAVREGQRVQPGAVLRRRVRLDGRAQADGAGEDRDPLAAARRLPAPRQGRAGHLPRRAAPSWRCRRRTRSTSRRPGCDELPAGGRTPLAEGLLEAARVLELERVRDPRRRPLLVVVTDGRATSGADAVARSRQAPRTARRPPASPALVVDCESGPIRLGLAARAGRAPAAPSTCRSPRSAPRR